VSALLSKALGGKEISRHLDSTCSVATGAALAGVIRAPHLRPEAAPQLVLTGAETRFVEGPLSLAPDALAAAQAREAVFVARDRDNELLDQERNCLETLIFDYRARVQSNKQIPGAESASLMKLLAEAEEWMSNVEEDAATAQLFADRTAALQEAVRAASATFAQHLSADEERKKKEKLERLEAEAEAAKSAPKSREKPKTNTEKIELAMKAKNQGNSIFKDIDYLSAAAKYIEALGCFEQMWDVSAPHQKEVDEIKLSCCLNLAACYLKLQKFDKAIHNCAEALRIDPNSSKALYRRAQAHVGNKNWDAAKADLEAAEKVDPKNADVKAELAKVQKQIDARGTREKKMFSKMFAGAGDT
jgi:tetratricopeptide (TPR) repeat protein